MLVVQLKGGLGNQLFQWALARALMHAGRAVALDPRIPRSGPRELAIAPLCSDMRLSTRASAGLSLSRRFEMSRIPTGYRRIIEPYHHYWPGVFSLRGRCLLEGYWQSPRYFARIAEDIRARVISYGEALLTLEGRRLLAEIQRDPGAVSVHVRRGDYVTDPRAAAHIGFIGIEYYRRALAMMRARGARTYYVFSDDLPWAEQHFDGVQAHVVPRSATLGPAGEVILMAGCHGHVVANSSFSWWGAWLDADPSLGVIAPSRWFRDATMVTNDLLPAAWLQIECTCGDRRAERETVVDPAAVSSRLSDHESGST